MDESKHEYLNNESDDVSRALALLEQSNLKARPADEYARQASQLLIKAYDAGDADAGYYLAQLERMGLFRYKVNGVNDPAEVQRIFLTTSAERGNAVARSLLNSICLQAYEETVGTAVSPHAGGPLADFDGKEIKINRTGVLTPIDATLTYENGKNILTLSANIIFKYAFADDCIEEAEKLEQAVIRGIKQWEGDYTVFGGQQLTVKMNITSEPERKVDNVYVIPVGKEILPTQEQIEEYSLYSEALKARVASVIGGSRSGAMYGLKWSVYSRKLVFLLSESGCFNEYRTLMHVMKHEFGHLLGLGDLYKSEVDKYPGVERGLYPELDSFYVSDGHYYQVMDNHFAPVSNNDIEMVVLAFRENKMQLYQQVKNRDRISEALGRGN